MTMNYKGMSDLQLKEFIEMRRGKCKRLYREWNSLADADLQAYERYQQEIKDAVTEVDRRDGVITTEYVGRYVSVEEIRHKLGVTRQRVHRLAIRWAWRKKNWERPYWYNLDDVQQYLRDRDHTQRSREMGATFRGILFHDEGGFHMKCLVCRQLRKQRLEDESLTEA